MKPQPKPSTPKPPAALGAVGKRFWTQVTDDYLLEDAHHLRLLENAGICLDRATAAAKEIKKHGVTTTNRFNEVKENPAANVERQYLQIFRQSVRELGLDVDPASAMRGPARPGTR